MWGSGAGWIPAGAGSGNSGVVRVGDLGDRTAVTGDAVGSGARRRHDVTRTAEKVYERKWL
jgi:hypothetical protein